MHNNLKVILLLVISGLALISPSTPVLADVPSVVDIIVEEEEMEMVLRVDFRHNSPSSNHYVDSIEVEIGGKVEEITDLDPQSSASFSESKTLGDGEIGLIRVRAHCNIHGWSQWRTLELEEDGGGGGGIPGFPLEALAFGLLVSAMILWISQRK